MSARPPSPRPGHHRTRPARPWDRRRRQLREGAIPPSTTSPWRAASRR